jgi:hypothetical protein
MKDRKIMLSTLWIFATLNYLYCDVLGLMDASILKQLLAGVLEGGIQLTPGFLLGASIMMEIPIALVLLSRILKYKANRVANIIAGTIMTIVQISSLFIGSATTAYYAFFSTIEISTTLFIVWYAWTWQESEAV